MSSLKDLASLIMVPSLYKDGELHTVKPLADENIIVHPDATDNNDGVDGTTTPSTSSNFTFSRGSNLAATRVDVNGLIEKGRENAILHSNSFSDSSWAPTDLNVTSGATDPNGGSTAWTIANTAANGIIQKVVSLSGLRSVSIYAKQGTHRYLRIGAYGGTQSYANFDLQDGVVSSGTKATIESIGGGWYRCTAWGADGTTGGVQIFPSNNPTSAPTTNGSIFIWRVQMESGLVATDYIETGASTAQAGILEDMPRLDYSGGASCPSLLLEPQRSNLFPNSEYFGSWQVFRGSLTANSITSPEGVVNAYRYEENADTGQHFVRFQSISMTSGTDYTASVFVKAGEKTSVILGTNAPSIWSASATFNLSTGEVTSGSGTIEPMENDWYRCIISGECLTTSSSAGLEITTSSGAGSSGDGLYIYGAQMEVGSYPTSYIPTYGTSASRAADEADCTDTGITLNVGTWYLEMKSFQSGNYGSGSPSIQINSTGGSAYISILSNQVANTMRCRVHNNITANYVGSSFPPTDVNKFAFKWDGTTFKFFRNGAEYSSIPFSTSVVFSIMNLPDISRAGLFPINQTLCFPTALTDSECIALTTL